MLEQLTRYFKAVHRMRRSSTKLGRSGTLMELEQLQSEVRHPRLANRVRMALDEGLKKAKAS